MRLSLNRSLTIRSRLLLYLICIVVITVAAISVVTVVLQSQDARDRVVAQLKSVATLKEQEVNSWAGSVNLNLDVVLSSEDIEADLSTLSRKEPGSSAYDIAYGRILNRFTWASNRMLLFEELFFMGPTGQVLLSTDRSHEGQKLGMNDYFTQGMSGDYIQEPSYSIALNKMTIVASCPVTYGGVFVGVLAGRASLDSLNAVMIGRAGLGATGETYLVGSNHRLLTDLRGQGYSASATYIRTAGADAAIDKNVSGFATYRGYAGDTVIGVYEWIPRLNVALLAEQGEAEALHTTRLALWITAGVGVFAAALAILASVALTRSIVRPLSELGETAGRIAAGDLDLTANVDRKDEIGTLAQSFNRMTGQLRDLVRSLEKRTQNLRAINQAGRQISSILELDQLLPYVASLLVRTFDYERVRILLLDDGAGRRGAAASGRLLTCGRDLREESREVTLGDIADLQAVVTVAKSGAPVLRGQPLDGNPEGPDSSGQQVPGGSAQQAPGDSEQQEESSSEVAVPIRVGERLAGVLAITSHSRQLDREDMFTAQTHADQLAIAVENSRLYHQAHELAASKERQRLARDLHDAVSQTLFSVSLIAEVLPRIYERDPEQGKERLEELRQLTRGALAEMRTLLLELRPAALADSNLPDLLKQLSEAVIGRSRIPIDLQIETSQEIPAEVRIAMYRIAQEALNNVAKHSGAERAEVRLRDLIVDGRGALELVVEDDGGGFDAAHTRPGSLGLGIMTERAEAIGAQLQIDSSPGEGTSVRALWTTESLPDSSGALSAGLPAVK